MNESKCFLRQPQSRMGLTSAQFAIPLCALGGLWQPHTEQHAHSLPEKAYPELMVSLAHLLGLPPPTT